MSSIIENVVKSRREVAAAKIAKAQEKDLKAFAVKSFGKAVDFSALDKNASAALIESKRSEWENRQEGRKCPVCGRFHSHSLSRPAKTEKGENVIPRDGEVLSKDGKSLVLESHYCADCLQELTSVSDSWMEYTKALAGDYAPQNAQWLRRDLDHIYAERDSRGISSRDGNITKISHTLIGLYDSLNDAQKEDFWKNVQAAIVSNKEKPSEEGFTAFLESNK